MYTARVFVQLCNDFDKKMGWAIYWATFSQTHLVTLESSALVKPAFIEWTAKSVEPKA
jgi:hypothetical protein